MQERFCDNIEIEKHATQFKTLLLRKCFTNKNRYFKVLYEIINLGNRFWSSSGKSKLEEKVELEYLARCMNECKLNSIYRRLAPLLCFSKTATCPC